MTISDAPQSTKLAIHGGAPAVDAPWPSWPVWDENERAGLLETFESGKWFYGKKVRQFEECFAAFHNLRYGVSCSNGTTAIEMGLRALGVCAGDEVIVPPYSFIATASAVIAVGAIPVFADIEPRTLCIDPDDVRKRITSRTRAIIPVHVGGRFADLAAVRAIADAHGLKILEDAAHCWGSLEDGKGPGTIGDCATFSFQESKNITAGEGGILLTNNAEIAELARSYSDCGRAEGGAWYDHPHAGSNLRLTEFQAAILLAQLGRLPRQIERRERSVEILNQRLQRIEGIHLPKPHLRMTRRSYHLYIFRIDQEALGATRDRFIEALCAEGVPASPGWVRPLYANGVFQSCKQGPRHPVTSPLYGCRVDYTQVYCPTCEAVCHDAVWLTQTLLLADDIQIERLADAIIKVASHARELT